MNDFDGIDYPNHMDPRLDNVSETEDILISSFFLIVLPIIVIVICFICS